MPHDESPAQNATNLDSESEDGGQFDSDELVDQLGGDLDMAKEVVELFVDQWPELLEKVRRGVEAGSAGDLRFAAHTLKGVIANFSRGPAMHTAGKLEAIGRDGGVSDTAELLTALDRQLRTLDDQLRLFLSSNQA